MPIYARRHAAGAGPLSFRTVRLELCEEFGDCGLMVVLSPTQRRGIEFGIAQKRVRAELDQQLYQIKMAARSSQVQRGSTFDFIHIEVYFCHQPNRGGPIPFLSSI